MLLRSSLLGLSLSAFVLASGACSSCSAPVAEGEGEGAGEGEGEGAGEGEGEGEGAGEGEGEGAGEGEGEGAGEGEGEGEGEGGPPVARLINGGGAGDGPIAGTLFVHVIDNVTLAPVANAFVRLDFATSNTELATDAGGLATFTSAELVGAVSITVHGAGITTETWLGVNATNVTIPVSVAGSFTAPASGALDVQITNIDNLQPQNGASYVVVLASVSSTKDLGNPANKLDDAGVRCTTSPAVLNNPEPACSSGFTMQSRVGTLTVMATIIGIDDGGTSLNRADDTIVGVQTYAVATGITVLANQTTAVNLAILEDNQLASADVAFPNTTPTGLADLTALVTIDRGDEGLSVVDIPFKLNRSTQPVPALAGPFVGDSYEVLGVADPNGQSTDLRAQSISLSYGVTDISGGINLPEWLQPPASLTVTNAGLTIAYTPPAEQSFAAIDIRHGGLNADNDVIVWNVGVFDNRSTVTLPNLSDNPIPAGNNGVVVLAVEVPNFDATSFVIPDATAAISRASRAVTTFTK